MKKFVFLTLLILLTQSPTSYASNGKGLMCQLSLHVVDSMKSYESWDSLISQVNQSEQLPFFSLVSMQIQARLKQTFWLKVFPGFEERFGYAFVDWRGSFGSELSAFAEAARFNMAKTRMLLGLQYPHAQGIGVKQNTSIESLDFLFGYGPFSFSFQTDFSVTGKNAYSPVIKLAQSMVPLAIEYTVVSLNPLAKTEKVKALEDYYDFYSDAISRYEHGDVYPGWLIQQLRVWNNLLPRLGLKPEDFSVENNPLAHFDRPANGFAH